MMSGNPNLYVHHPPYFHQPPTPQQPPSPSSPSAASPYFFHPQFVVGSSPAAQPPHNPSSYSDNDFLEHELLPLSWSQLLLGGLPNEEAGHFNARKPATWEFEEEEIYLNRTQGSKATVVKREASSSSSSPGTNEANKDKYAEELPFPAVMPTPTWTHATIPASSPTSCVTSLSCGNLWDFSKKNLNSDHTSECNSTATGGACKKARVHPPSTQPPLKVRKEKLGDRITALHQLVSPFGKTDTASVLLEAIGYIRFLQGQIEALSSPYLHNNNGSGNAPSSNRISVHGEANYAFSGEGVRDSCHVHKPLDLRSRGLCLVPVSCTAQVGGNDINGADYWAPAFSSGF